MVVCKALYGDFGIWVRPAQMWNETIEREGKTVQRFTQMTGETDPESHTGPSHDGRQEKRSHSFGEGVWYRWYSILAQLETRGTSLRILQDCLTTQV